jgi:MSHA biogenesis protein MshK
MARHLTLSAVPVAVLAALALSASGQERRAVPGEPLADPTRPPAFIAGSGSDSAMALTGPVLQSVLLSATRKAAIISGERVELGEKVGEARLARLTEDEAVLEGPQGRTVLKLVPKVEKKWKASP